MLYIASPMWISGVMQGLMWRAVNDDGTLTYASLGRRPNPGYFVRFLGGCFFVTGMLLMAYNAYRTVTAPKVPNPSRSQPPDLKGFKTDEQQQPSRF